MKIQVLGSGCLTCKKLYELTKQAVEETGLKEEVKYLTGQEGLQKMIDMGVMSSPVLAINGKSAMTGFVDNVEKIKKLILEAKEK
ncbi:thioredoxin family protein [Patescibacteria group bacterium]|nr:thioredoxin family protein [Patescibacteria group bacterium]MBU1457242.1 thioredoxin family protein [Patescibacteria group bacterium]